MICIKWVSHQVLGNSLIGQRVIGFIVSIKAERLLSIHFMYPVAKYNNYKINVRYKYETPPPRMYGDYLIRQYVLNHT